MHGNKSPIEASQGNTMNTFPMSAAQQGIWFAQQMNPTAANSVFKIAEYLVINDEVAFAPLSQAIRQAVADTQAYNMCFQSTDNGPVQTALLDQSWSVRFVDCSAESDPHSVALDLMQQDMDSEMSLATGPLFSYVLFKISPTCYYLYHCVHHIISDGYGSHLFMQRVAELYNAFYHDHPLPACSFTAFTDVMSDENAYLSSPTWEKDRQYWLKRWQQPPVATSLSRDNAVCAEVYRQQDYLPEQLSQQLRGLASQLNVTLPQLLVTLFAFYLHRMTGQETLALGFPVTGRRTKAARQVPFMAANVMPLQLHLGLNASLSSALDEVKRNIYGALKHQGYRSERLKSDLGLLSDHQPLFSTLINIVPFEYDMVFGHATATVHNLSSGPTDDLSITVFDRGENEGLELCLDANSARYSFDEIDTHFARMVLLLQNVVNQPDGVASTWEMVLPHERTTMLQEFNATQAYFPTQFGLHHLFEQQAALTPNAIALEFGATQMTYNALNQQANQLAHWLADHGIGAQSRVALSLPRNHELLVAVMAVLKTGAAYVPMDPNYPLDRRSYMVEDCQPSIIFTTKESDLNHLEFSFPCQVVEFDRVLRACSAYSDEDLVASEFSSHQLAYLIYTSGSTGKPKGVMLEHRNAVNLVEWAINEYQPATLHRTLFSTSLNFDLSIFEIFTTLSCGGTLVIVENALSLLEGHYDLTLINTVPSALAALLEHHAIPSGVQVINVAGEPLKRHLAERLFAETAVPRLCNLYAPSETTTYSTFVMMERTEPFAPHIGKPLGNTQVYLLDEQQRLTPIGVVGEIVIGGEGVARGYLNREDLTQERFIADPFSAKAGARMYRTGDLGRWLPDGNIEFLGRNDFQVKVRGFRIELGEIEAALQQCPGIDSAVVVAKTDEQQTRLVAYYTLTEGEVAHEAIMAHLAQPLPDYMLPSALVQLDHIPLTPNGKVDRSALPEPTEVSDVRNDYVAPQTEFEQRLATLWQALLGCGQVSRYDHFFQLGGHSLLAAQLLSRIRDEFAQELQLVDIFNQPTLKRMASFIANRAEQDILPEIEVTDHRIQFPLSAAQQRLWLLEQLDANAAKAYVMRHHLALNGPLHLDALTDAITAVVKRHTPLRTQFVVVNGTPMQQIQPAPQPFPIERAETLTEWQPEFDLTKGYLFAVCLAQHREQEWQLGLALHHIIADGWSVRVLLNDIVEQYNRIVTEQPDLMEPLSVQYGDYAVWQQRHFKGAWIEKQKAYWIESLNGIPDCLTLPMDRVRPEQQRYEGHTFSIALNPELTQALKAFSAQYHSTLYMTLMASWALLMGRLAKQNDVVIGTPVAGRSRTELESMIGMFVNTQAMRVQLNPNSDIVSLIEQVKETTLAAQANQDIPFEQIVEAIAPNRSMAHNPIFQVIFALHNTPDQLINMEQVELNLLPGDSDTAQFDLSIGLSEVDGRLEGYVNYATSLFDEATVRRYVAHWKTLLRQMLAQPNASIMALPLLNEFDTHQIIEGFNCDKSDFFAHHTLAQRFEAQVKQFAERIAVSFGESHLTYAELNASANQLAHWLRAQGVRPDSRVAIALERDEQLLVAILATLKAGGAYVPLDPNYPKERLEYSLQDSAPQVVITRSNLCEKLGQLPEQTTLALLDKPQWLDESRANIDADEVGLTAHHMAYIIYTSGSTGKPKGVMVEHHNVLRLMAATQGDYQFNEQDVWTLFHSYAFDFSVWEIWGALLFGGRLVVVPHLVSRAPDEFYHLLCHEKVTVLNQTPSAFRQLIAAQQTLAQAKVQHTLRYVIFGGEALELSALAPWYARAENEATQLVNMYGITETTVHTTYYPLSAQDVSRTGASPIGQGLKDLRLYILDEHKKPVPIGVTGELYVSGAGVARGYLNRDDLTAERFLADPFVNDGHTRMYKSGDLGRWLADGSIEYLGRNDDQVKIRGFRIELGEIEACVRSFAGITDAAVVAQKSASGDHRLVAYFVSSDTSKPIAVDALRDHVADLVPSYMVPSAWMPMAVLPLTSNGKLDRRALPEPSEDGLLRQQFVAPQGKAEKTIAALWSELLGVAEVGRNDNFFELGGHSLLAVQLIDQLRQQGYELAVKSLFNQPTLAALATTLSHSEASTLGGSQEQTSMTCGIPQQCQHITPEMLPLVALSHTQIEQICAKVPGGAANVQDIYPLAPLQEGILFHHLLEQQGDAYLTRLMTAFSSQQEMDRFIDGLQQVIARHDILRTAMAWQGLEKPVQVVWREATMKVETLTLSAEDSAQGDVVTQLQAHFDPASTRIDVTQAPLIEAYRVEDKGNQRWILCLLIHHLINDHTTLELLVEEVFAHIDGKQESLAQPVPFGQFIAQLAQERDEQQDRDYFAAQLADIDEPCAPFGVLKLDNPTTDVEMLTVAIDDSVAATLREQAKRLNVSTASLFHLAWGKVVQATTGQQDAVFGTVLFGRMGAGNASSRTMGMFLNTLPLRINCAENSLAQAVKSTHKALAELLNYEHASLIQAQQQSGVAAQMPLFTSLLNYRYQGGSQAQAEILKRVDLVYSAEQTNYPISLDVNDFIGGGFSVDVHVAKVIGCERVAQMMINALTGLANGLRREALSGISATALATPNAAWQILSQEERELLLEGFNQTEKAYPTESCIQQRIEETAAKLPHKVAVQSEQGFILPTELTFAELNAHANQLAHWLVKQGVRPDSRVAVSLERSSELVVALVAILKAGGAYVPMDPGYPEDRLEYMVQDSQPVVLITTNELRSRLGAIPASVQVVNFAGKLPWENESQQNLDPNTLGLTSRHLAYIIYTSGSTGKPKGVMNEHRGVVNRLSWMVDDYGFSRDDVILQKTPFSFDVSVWEFFAPLWVGATLVMAKPEGHKDPSYLRELIERRHVSILHFVPPMLQMFLEGTEQSRCPSLRLMFCSGEALPAETIRRTYQTLPHVELHNLYGPTEAAVDVTQWHCPRDLVGDRVSIGSSVANTRMYVLDSQGQPAPLGVAGEIFIGGVQVARGYLNRDDLTAERFVRDPFVTDPNATMYKTGDVGRWLADGTIEYQGRNDDQVKIRGFRVELGEISSALKGCSDVLEAVVIARGTSANKQLVGYFTAEQLLSIEAIKAQMGERLPEYMVPAALMQIEAIPLTPNGKMDRKALPEPAEEAFVRHEYVAPQGPREVQLATLWQHLLGLAQVGRHDNFFELGGHSLLAIQLIEKLRQQGTQLAVKALFASPTLCELASLLTETQDSAWQVPDYQIAPSCERITPEMLPLVELTQAQLDHIAAGVDGGMTNIQDIYPLAPLQEGILFHHRMAKERDPYISPVILSFCSAQSVRQFTDALQQVIDRHDILRTSMAWDGLEEPVQVVWRHAPLAAVTLQIHSQDVLAELIERANGEYAQMDVTRAPLMAAYQTEDVAQQRWLLCLVNHHLNSDHTTMELLVEEVFAHIDGKQASLPKPLPFRNFVATSRLNANSEGHKRFFTEQFAEIDEPCAPFGVIERSDDYEVNVQHVELERHLSEQLRAVAKRQGVSAASVFHLAWGLVLRAVSGSSTASVSDDAVAGRDNVVFGTVLFGRMSAGEGADRVLGMFLNTLPLKLNLAQVSLQQALQRTHQALANLLDYEHASLALAQQCSGLAGSTPLFSSLLNYRYDGGSAQLSSATTGKMDILYSAEHTNYPATISVNDHQGIDFSLDLQMDERISSERLGAMMLATLQQMVSQLISGVERPVEQLCVLPNDEYAQLVNGLNQTQQVVDQVSCVHQLIERQAARHPNAIALSSAERSMTYAELNAQANQLAHWMQQQGITIESRVALCFDRTPTLIVAMLAVLKAGAGYVPLDPAYPAERLQFMLRDSQPELLLTDGTVDMVPVWGETVPCVREVNVLQGRHLWADCIADNLPTSTYRSEQLAYIIYTSGSTGQPKGVMVEHRNLVNLIEWHNHAFNIGAGDCVSSVAGLGFDAAVWEIWPPLCAGAYLTLPSLAVSRDPEQLLAWWVEQPIKVGFLSTPVAELSFARGVHPNTLKTLLVGGDKLTRRPHANAPYQLVNNYGPTETTVVATSGVISGNELHIGRGITNTQIYLLDAHGQLVPRGVTGELYIGGLGVARGYLNRPDLTQDRFMADPFSAHSGARMYRTGDLARWLPDGTLEYQGRNDDQIKIRGFRIELGEIEVALKRCAGVVESVVVAQSTKAGDKRLVAYVVGAVEPSDLRMELAAQLPQYMVPVAYVVLSRLPLTANGKIDRKALPQPEPEAFVTQDYQAPQGEVEEQLAELWQELLGVARVGRSDNFFELGGHSLLAVKLITRIRDAFQIELAISDLFAMPELSTLAQHLLQQSMADIDMEELKAMALAAGYDESELDLVLAQLADNE